ncbi:serine/threonine-protein kinase HipA [Singulisphaera sp. GP187]|uniref:HipA domain-containing protein n=1 Tax=Singulisphaera sp. GP187 TaxID=1882752 RepID=UPI0009278105|nr:HipA domain-containing protein [Singulisphaera sp. GP187]SIO65183.1 serine/threonine-protein kinase HipA [Singulisphaera sp. GP187]
MTRCPGCFKDEQKTYCGACRNRLFGGKKVPFILPFSRSDYDQVTLEVTTDRMSISGIQTKISLALNAGRLKMVMSGGQHILKPRPHGMFKRLEMAPINEHLTMQLARQVFKIEVAENALVAFEDGELAYLVRRFDVQPDGRRSLQEDFAQIAARSEEAHGKNYKYDGSYEEIGQLIRRHVAASPVDSERYFTLVAFNYLVNNGDAHLKNFSLIRDDQTDEYNLTPAYDLLNTRLHLPDETHTALELFKDGFETEGYKANAFYAYDDFVVFAQKLGLVESHYKRILERFIPEQEAVFSLIECSMLSDECKDLYKKHVKDQINAFSYSHAGLR